jgi:outer membrane protein assembly factor BamA
MSIFKKLYQCLLLSFITLNAASQNVDVATLAADSLLHSVHDSSAKITIHSINLYGNKKTKSYIILREVHFKAGDSITAMQLNNELQKAKQQVYNTNLFHEVTLVPSLVDSNTMDINLTVRERWYIFPFPQFQLVDRNINEWLRKSHGDLERVVYGVKFTHYNLTGHRDQLRLTFLNGFTRNYSFLFTQPYGNKALTSGFSFGGGYVQNRDFIYKTTQDNKPVFFNNGKFSKNTIYATVGYSIRKNILNTHYFNITYSHVSVTDSLLDAVYNPNYFKTNSTAQNLWDFSYTYQYINTNNVAYPLKGVTGMARLFKRGLGFTSGTDMFYIEGAYRKYWDLGKSWYFNTESSAKITLPFTQSYINQVALGYKEVNLRGLELYVVDGLAFGLLKSTLKKKLFSLDFPLPFKILSYKKIPFVVFGKTFSDLGYAYTKKIYETDLSNKLLYSAGFGIDILTLYDTNLKIEYSFNQLGKSGLFFQTRIGL